MTYPVARVDRHDPFHVLVVMLVLVAALVFLMLR